MATAGNLTENVKLRLDAETLRAIERLAERADRTVAAEMRRALRTHVEQNNQKGSA